MTRTWRRSIVVVVGLSVVLLIWGLAHYARSTAVPSFRLREVRVYEMSGTSARFGDRQIEADFDCIGIELPSPPGFLSGIPIVSKFVLRPRDLDWHEDNVALTDASGKPLYSLSTKSVGSLNYARVGWSYQPASNRVTVLWNFNMPTLPQKGGPLYFTTELGVGQVPMVPVKVAVPAQRIAATTQPAWQRSESGSLILRPFVYAPYPHLSRENGFKGQAETYPKVGHYDDSTVGIVIPSAYAAGESVNYVVHFHGHKQTVASVLKTYRLTEQLAASKINAILIIPQGPKDASDDGFGKLELDNNGLKNLLEEVSAFLKSEGKISTDKIGKVAISAHSGGYNAAGAVLDHGGLDEQISDVILLDASYGSLPWFTTWCAAGKDHRLVSLFSDHLQPKNQRLMAMLDKAKVKYEVLDEKMLSESALKRREPLFMHTSLPHNDVPMKTDYFRRLVETSSLSQ